LKRGGGESYQKRLKTCVAVVRPLVEANIPDSSCVYMANLCIYEKAIKAEERRSSILACEMWGSEK